MKKLIIIIFVLSFFYSCGSKKTEDQHKPTTQIVSIKTPSIMCGMCVNAIENALDKIDAVEKVEVDLKNKITTVSFDTEKISLQDLEYAISEAGYDANNIVRNREVYEQLPACCKDGK